MAEYANLVGLPDTGHSYTKYYNGSYLETSDGGNSIDGNFDTRFGYGNGGGDPPAVREVIITSEHTFPRAVDLTQVKYRMYANARANGKYIRTHNFLMYIEYYNGAWYKLGGSEHSGGGGEGESGYDTGQVTYSGSLTSVTKIRAYVKAFSFVTGGEAGANSAAWIYEIQGWGQNYVDIGLRAYDGTGIIKIACEPAGVLTSPLRIHKNGTTYAIALVDPADNRGSKIRIRTSSGVKTLVRLN